MMDIAFSVELNFKFPRRGMPLPLILPIASLLNHFPSYNYFPSPCFPFFSFIMELIRN